MPEDKETPTQPVETPPASAQPLPHIPGTINNPPYVPPPTPSPSTAGVDNADMPAAEPSPPSPPPPAAAEDKDKDDDNGDKRAARPSRDRGR